MPRNILVVDDEKDVLEIVAFSLRKAGYGVTTACTGAEALAQMTAEPPDLIVLDVMIPGMDGFEVLGKIREDETNQDLPVIMLTALDPAPFAAKGRALGADFYWVKPFDPEQLVTLVNRIFEFA